MRNRLIIIAAVLLQTAAVKAQQVTLPPFTRWETNNAPDCKNVVLTKDSMLLPVKNQCRSEGILANWRPMVNISNDAVHYSIPAGAKAQMSITYSFKPVGGDVLGFNGSFDPESDNSDIAFSRALRRKDGITSLPETGGEVRTEILLVNFSNEMDNPVWQALSALKGSMNFSLSVTTNGGETHHGSVAVIKTVKLEVVK